MEKTEGTLTTRTCKRCGHTWIPRVTSPTVCPRCKSYIWDTAKQPEMVSDVGATYGKKK